jgi:hypothetical protein
MHGYAQPRAFPTTALLRVAAALRGVASLLRAAARRVDTPIARARTPAAGRAETMNDRELHGRAHLDIHVLKDIGAPHWLVARAAGEPDRERLRWIGRERC